RRPQAHSGLHLRGDGRAQAGRVRAHPALPRPCRLRQGQDAMSPENEEQKNDAPETEATEEPTAEEKPKRKRASRKKAAPKPKAEEEKAPEAEAEEPEAVEEEEAEEAEEEAAEEKPKRARRRGSADVTASKKRSRRPKPDAEPVYVRAQAKYVRSSPRKARLVIDHIR